MSKEEEQLKTLKTHFVDLETRFLHEVEAMVTKANLSMMDAIIHFAERSGVELETLGSIINKRPAMRAKVQIEAEALHHLPKVTRLPI